MDELQRSIEVDTAAATEHPVPLIVRVPTTGGHNGQPGWYENYQAEAKLLAFARTQMGIYE